MVTEQGELIQKLQSADDNDDNEDIDEYVNNMDRIIARNLEIFTDMKRRVDRFKKLLKEEEIAAQNASQTV